MKEIKVTRAYVLEAFDGKPATWDAKEIGKIIDPFERNKLKIIDSAFFIERNLESIIAHYFFGREDHNKDSRVKFESLILNSDWCSYSSKRKLILQIIEDKKYLNGKSKDQYGNLLRKVMSYRNAFTHGEMRTNGSEVRLKYFEGTPQIKVLDDVFLTQIEKDLTECEEITHQISLDSGTTVLHNADTPL